MSAYNSVIVCPNAGDNGSSAVPTATIFTYAGATAPAGWLMCDGSAVSRATYANLFASINTTYGSGNGTTTFNIPNTANRTMRGKGAGAYATLGATGGADTQTLVANQLPAHQHGVYVPGQTTLASGSGLRAGTANVDDGTKTIPGIYDNTGANFTQQAVSITNSFIVLNYIIKT